MTLRVLLISPLPGLDPPNGDVVYTTGLLDDPPDGVRYTTYAQAIEAGDLREKARRGSDPAGGSAFLSASTVREGLVNRLRRRGVLFREPFRFFEVRPGAFDLIHCHVFSVRLDGADIPTVVSNAAPIEWLYRDGLRWPNSRVVWARAADRALATATRVEHTSYQLPRAARLVCFTERLRAWYAAHGVVDRERIDVVPCSIAVPPTPARIPSARPARVAFVGDYEVKGGDVALAAFEIVRRTRPDARLVVIGPRARHPVVASPAVDWVGRVPRAQLLGELLPTIDVLAYPTRFDGLPLTLLEAMACGVPVAASDYEAIPEILGEGDAGLLSPVNDEGRLAENILELLEPTSNAAYAAAAHRRALEYYSNGAVRPKLAASYEAATSG